MGSSTERDGRRARGDDGVALVEFAFVMVLLFSMIFGIISYGLILSFKQDMTRAAAEGARAGATAFPASGALTEAQDATDDAVRAFGGDNWKNNGCTRTGMTCHVAIVDCATMAAPTPATTEECVVVELTYDYKHHPLYGEVPLIGGLIKPDTIHAKSVARTNE